MAQRKVERQEETKPNVLAENNDGEEDKRAKGEKEVSSTPGNAGEGNTSRGEDVPIPDGHDGNHG